jgi:hypothetical protein
MEDVGMFSKLLRDELEKRMLSDEELDALSIEQATVEFVEKSADALFDELKHRMNDMLVQKHSDERGFNDRLKLRWEYCLNIFETFIVISREIGEEFNKKYRKLAVESKDAVFEALVFIHGRSCLISEEILCLLLNGFPDGALSRWRSLHELAVYASLIMKYKHQIAERFLNYQEVETLKELVCHREYAQQLGEKIISEEEFSSQKAVVDKLSDKYGKSYLRKNGWAKNIIKDTAFSSLESDVNLDFYRPYYKMACAILHAGHRDEYAPFGTSECQETIILVGRSNSNINEPIRFAISSLMIITSQLVCAKPDIDMAVELNVLSKFKKLFFQEFCGQK